MKAILVFFAALGTLWAGELKVEDPWIRAVPPASQATAAFMVITNTGAHSVAITGGQCAISPDVRPMVTTRQGDGVMGMAFVERFEIPAGATRKLEPGGDHIMLMKLDKVPPPGSKVSLVLTTESDGRKGKITLEVSVR